jgi:hypothetical protein
MSRTRLLLAVTVLALLLAPLPVGAEELPDACERRALPLELAEDEVLVERTLYFTGNAPVGNVDGNQNPGALRMTPDEPEGGESKTYVSRPGGVGNPAFARNQFHGHFTHELEEWPQRVVCASVRFWAATQATNIAVQLFVDAPSGTGEHIEFDAQAAATGGAGVREYWGSFRNVEVNAEWDLTVQFNPGLPGAAVFYDSGEHPSSFTFVTVQQVETSQES